MWEKEPSYTVGGNINWYSHYGRQYKHPQKIKNKLPYDPVLWYLSKEYENTNPKKIHAHPYIHSGIIHNSQDCKSMDEKMWYIIHIYTME